MRLTTRDDDVDGLDDDGAQDRLPEGDPLPDLRRRVGTLAFFAVIGLVAWGFIALGGRDASGPDRSAASAADDTAASSLRAGTYRLPGVSASVSLTLPDGWRAGDSIWGPASQGIAAVTSGRAGASISVAVFDLGRLRPYGASAQGPRDRVGDDAWFARSLGLYTERVEPRVRDRIVGSRLDWRPPAVLAWLLTHTDRGPIEVSDDVSIAGRRGDLVTFSFPGPTSELFDAPGPGSIALRPGNTYVFWVPGGNDDAGRTIMLGIARELGAAPSTTEWDVVRTLRFGE